ncbi:hypothetical protein HPB50_019080 [Hyalomma asiaticum]|uniref:Uncharacterized protein n=1 Tax=Hyalomma asiaticum TaxID=266040 RepID=A0ACB7RMY3_HYAAI|nr:hypothetical protein HPB50_019080 [Hyalomma asiaticum]
MAKIFASRQTSRLRRLIVGAAVRNTMAIRAALLLFFCVALVRLASTVYVTRPQDDIGYFWHVTDFHVDKDYTTRGSRDLSCHLDANRTILDNIGAYGDFVCDAPKLLAQSAVEAMERIHPTPDFVLWTGLVKLAERFRAVPIFTVFISGHVGPGYYSRSLVGQRATVVFFDDMNERYQDLIAQYKDVVAGQFFGHQHMNAFVILSDKNGNSMHLAGSVTPWGSKDPVYRTLSEPTNPSVRLYTYRRSTGELLDYSVYYLDLDKANAAAASQQQAEWEFLYSASKEFGQQDLSTESMVELAHRLTSSPELLSRYINLTSALKDTGPCDATCRQTMLCAILGSRRDSHTACISQESKVHTHAVQMEGHGEATTTVRDVLVGLSVSVVIVVGIVLVVRAKRARMMQGPRYGRFR